jgi:hypothetical protein
MPMNLNDEENRGECLDGAAQILEQHGYKILFIGIDVKLSRCVYGVLCSCGNEGRIRHIKVVEGDYSCRFCRKKKLRKQRKKKALPCVSASQNKSSSTTFPLTNGRPTSQPQRKIAAMLNGELNYRCGKWRIDVAIIYRGIQMAIEYDSWYYHSKDTKQKERDDYLVDRGWRVLHIRSNATVPTEKQLMLAISDLLIGSSIQYLVLHDWGRGNTFDQVRQARHAGSL